MSKESKQELMGRLIHEARASEAATKAFDDAAFAALGINDTDGRCLDILDNEGPLTAGRLAELSGLTTAAVTTVLDRLERAGYARRVRDEDDRRRVIVEVTPKMRERAEQIWGPLAMRAQNELAKASMDDLRTVIEYFELNRAVNEEQVERVRKIRFED